MNAFTGFQGQSVDSPHSPLSHSVPPHPPPRCSIHWLYTARFHVSYKLTQFFNNTTNDRSVTTNKMDLIPFLTWVLIDGVVMFVDFANITSLFCLNIF